MAWRELIISALFLYIISPTTCKENGQCYPSDDNSPGDNRPPEGKCCTLYPGMAQIDFNNGNTTTMICSGFHIKPWAILSVADCVKGKLMSNLSVKITNDPLWNTTEVKNVMNVTTHPYYKNGSREYNFAIVFISNPTTATTIYKLYPFDVSPHELLKDKIRTFAREWQKLNEERLVAYGREFYATDNFTICGESAPLNDSFCVFRTGYNPDYTQRDVGIPLYFVNSWDITVIGVYMGNGTTGHLFQKIYPVVPWINSIFKSNAGLEVDDDGDDSCTNGGSCEVEV